MDELCIQFKKSRLETYELFKNIIKFGQSLLYGVDSINNPILSLIQKNEYEIKKRGDLEGNINYKHLISYFIVYDPFNKKILSYQRTSHSGEQRLVGNKSIGWVDIQDLMILEVILIILQKIIKQNQYQIMDREHSFLRKSYMKN